MGAESERGSSACAGCGAAAGAAAIEFERIKFAKASLSLFIWQIEGVYGGEGGSGGWEQEQPRNDLKWLRRDLPVNSFRRSIGADQGQDGGGKSGPKSIDSRYSM